MIEDGRGARQSMNQGLRTAALAGLLLAASVSHAAIPDGTVDPAHIKYAGRASPAVPALRSSAAFVLDSTHSSVLYSRLSDVVVPTGRTDENVASPEDLSKLVMAAAKIPEIREYSTDTYYEVRVGRRMMSYRNTDSLVSRPDWKIEVQKTGYISRAGRCLVMQTVIEDRTVVIVLLNSFGKRTRVADARRVRKWMEATLVTHEASAATST